VLRWLKRRDVVHGAIVTGLILSWTLLQYFGFAFLTKEELVSVDNRIHFGRTAPVDPNIVFLAIDADCISLNQLDEQVIEGSRPLSLMRASFPYSREVYADVSDRLFSAGAKVVAIDVLFLPQTPNDLIWKETIDKYRSQLVIGMNLSDDFEKGTSTLSLPSVNLFPEQDPMDERLGYVNFWKHSAFEETVRDAQYRNNLENINHKQAGAERLPMFYSLAARAVQKSGHARLVPNDLESRSMRFAGKSGAVFPTYSLYKIFDPHSWQDSSFRNGDFFRGKIVLIGPQGNWAKDQLITPWGLMNGAEIHLNAINALLQNEFLHSVSDLTVVSIIVGSGVLAFLLAMGVPSVAWRFLATIFFLGGYMAALIWAYNGPGWLLPAVGPIGVFCGATGLGFIYDFVLAQVEKLQLRATFERYTSPNEAKYLLDHMDSYKEMLVGTRKPVTILFSDIRGFTTMTEKADSQELVTKLNEYLTAMVDCVFRYDGSLDKFIGDAVVGAWGKTPYNFGPKEDAARAVRAALAMMKELRQLNAKWTGQGREEWHIGIGLNHGEVIVGDIGSQKRKEFAVIGDAVNLTARLESLTKEYQVDILIGESVVELVRNQFHFQTVYLVQVKGKTEAVDTFTVLGEKSEALSSELQQFLAAYEDGVRAFRGREFARAKGLFEQALQIRPGDHLAGQYLLNCEAFIQNPPDATWTGVQVMTKK
jgi:adenylate cyclase